DPQVSGVRPIALGRATKLLRYIAAKDKTYVGIIKFREPQEKKRVEELFAQFTGEIEQTPPKMSAVRRRRRKRVVHYLKLLEARGRFALFETKVDAGTYIRTLCVDIGKKCGGARMEELRRVAVGNISEKKSHTMQELIDAMHAWKEENDSSLLGRMIHRPEEFIGLPKVFLKESALEAIFAGAQVMVPAVEKFDKGVKEDERVAMYAGKRFVGVGIAKLSAEELGKRKRGLAVKLERVHRPD
ncbi:TPA: RNA-guided pseudouridylation complex pseudouridine synthase subunit Cbf5, partial [Candidatus Micrarchaeota archaeon]|nr:RNA-guided pseudouridylation complex pseudouridine synthase subunit Cbf5 [Candidatus Micrarchaeota archaeon]